MLRFTNLPETKTLFSKFSKWQQLKTLNVDCLKNYQVKKNIHEKEVSFNDKQGVSFL